MSTEKGVMSRRERLEQGRGDGTAKEPLKDRLKKFPAGFYILIAGCVWALVELVMSVMYFF